MMTRAFGDLPVFDQRIHLVAQMWLTLTIVLLIAPAAVHTIAFGGRDHRRFHGLRSRIIAMALVPMIGAIAGDFWVALFKLQGGALIPRIGASLAAACLVIYWFALPLIMRVRMTGPRPSGKRLGGHWNRTGAPTDNTKVAHRGHLM
jgi:hypothetical protein